MAFALADLRLIICEDEYLLANDLAQQFAELGATVLATVPSLAALHALLGQGTYANAAVLDVQLSDGEIYPVVPRLEAFGMALVFYSAYLLEDRPDDCAHIPWLDKLASAHALASVLCAAHDARRPDHNH